MSPILNSTEENSNDFEESFRIITDNASDAIIRIDETGLILFLNKAAENIFGYRKDELTGEHLTRLMPEELREVHNAAFKKYLQTGRKNIDWSSVEVPGRNKNGTDISLEISFGEYLQNGQKFFIGIARDISERKKVLQTLVESEKVLQGTIDSLTAHIAVLDHRGVIKKVNKAWNDFALANDYTGKNFAIGTNYIDACETAPDSPTHCRMQAYAASQGIKSVIAGEKELFEMEYPCHSPQAERWFIMRVTRFRHENETRLVVAHENISSRKFAEQKTKANEERYRLLSEALPAFIFVTDREGKTTFANRRWYDFTGFTEQATLGTGWADAIHPEDLPKVFEKWLTSVKSGDIFETEYRFCSHGGDFRWFFVRVVPRKDDEGRIVEWFGTATDIEDRKKAEEELLKSEIYQRKQAEATNRAKDEFLSVLSHELRTPLNAMLGWIRMLKDKNLEEKIQKRAVEVIERNIILQNELIEDLLDVSRIISEKMSIEKKVVNFSQIISDVVDIAKPLAEKKKIELSFTNQADSETVFGDPVRLHQIILNILNNSLKFTPEDGSVQLNLSKENEFVVLSIKDTGIGIDPEILPFVFERFQQADSSTRRNFSGLGLGLTIVKHLTELHGGNVWAFSEGKDRGSTFTLTFPIKREDNKSKNKRLTNPESKFQKEEFKLDGARILMVDDNLEGLLPLQILLEQQHARVVVTDSAEVALEKLSREDFDILISDIGMPNIDGFEIIRQVRQNLNKKIPAIALTAYASVSDKEKTLAAGFDAHFSKPLDFDELLPALINFYKNPDSGS